MSPEMTDLNFIPSSADDAALRGLLCGGFFDRLKSRLSVQKISLPFCVKSHIISPVKKRGTCLVKTHCFRLRRGADLLSSLEDYAKTQHLKAASVVCAVGCVSAAVVRDASGVNIRALCEPLEIVSLMGTLSEARTHLHISFSREDLSTVGGHLREGCIVNTTAEIVLLELDGVRFDAEYDEDTGYDELVILEDTP